MFAASKTAGAVSAEVNYIESCFSTWLYTGNGSTQTITNGIDLSTKGGLVWIKSRSNALSHSLIDTVRGQNKILFSNLTDAQATSDPATGLTSFDTTGFSLGPSYTNGTNSNGVTNASWTFRKQPKFFDVVTWSGNDTTKVISHSLGSVPGCIIVKSLLASGNWRVWHRGLTSGNYAVLNSTAAQTSTGAATVFGNNSTTVDPTSTGFTVGSTICADGENYVAYVFAHNAGGFGLTGTDNVISCGLCTSGTFENLGYEPQWILLKNPNSSGSGWKIYDNMRGGGLANYVNQNALEPNTSSAESSNGQFSVSATGFTFEANAIYIAIRRGPMKVPTSGTSVFAPTNVAQASAPYAYSGFPVDMAFRSYTPGGLGTRIMDRLRGASAGTQKELNTTSTAAETDTVSDFSFTYNTGISATSFSSNVFWMLRRAPSFFDEVCYTGNGTSGTTKNHNLGVVPELVILKDRSAVQEWRVMCAYYNNNVDPWSYRMALNTTGGISGGSGVFNDTAPTASVFTLGNNAEVNASGDTYVAYLFATCAGVSKVGSYTGNGTTQTINCGFTGGARFVLIKRTDSTGDWYVYDTARGMTVLTDPYLLLNSTAAESATLGSVTTVSTGFAVNASILAAINTNGASYIFLAIA